MEEKDESKGVSLIFKAADLDAVEACLTAGVICVRGDYGYPVDNVTDSFVYSCCNDSCWEIL